MRRSKATSPPIINLLPAALPRQEYERLSSHLELVSLHISEVLYEAGGSIRYVCFPHYSMISLLILRMSGEKVEVGVISRQGLRQIACECYHLSIAEVDRFPKIQISGTAAVARAAHPGGRSDESGTSQIGACCSGE